MPADIVLSKDTVEVIEGRLVIGNSSIGAGRVHFHTNNGGRIAVEIGNKDDQTGSLSVEDRGGKVSISKGRITVTDSVRASSMRAEKHFFATNGSFIKASARELTVGVGDYHEMIPEAGLINVKSSTGKKSIILDGSKGDIVLDEIGSLLAVIKDLQRQINELKA